MSDFISDFRPEGPRPEYDRLVSELPGSGVHIGHIDAGVAAHEAYGPPDALPANILVDQGRNFFDAHHHGSRPVTPLRYTGAIWSRFTEYPDHGVKTLSVILGNTDRLRGVAPGAQVVPYRVSNGPLFRGASGPFCLDGETARIGRALDHMAGLDPSPGVVSISMGNPGWLGPFLEIPRQILGGEIGIDDLTKRALDRAYERGVIVVCAAGQVVNTMVQPALYPRTIAAAGFDKTGGVYQHYPVNGYNVMEFIDIWAQAERINRAAYALDDPARKQIFAEDRPDLGEPSGTSYACPQVAAAAALWRAKHKDALATGVFAAKPWKIVEAFRHALQSRSKDTVARMPFGKTVPIKALDIERLLTGPLIEPADSDKKNAVP